MNQKELEMFVKSILVHTKTAKTLSELQRNIRAICPKDSVREVDEELADIEEN